ncbi:MAG TPA: hypothetical protein VIU16_02975 [Gaiellaceae bacterium]
MKRILNIRSDEKSIEQRCEGKRYIWGPGEAMDLPDNIANWMLKKLNSKDRNEQRDRDSDTGKVLDTEPWVKEVPIPKGELADAEKGVVRAQHKPKPKADAPGQSGSAQGAPSGGDARPPARIGDKPAK